VRGLTLESDDVPTVVLSVAVGGEEFRVTDQRNGLHCRTTAFKTLSINHMRSRGDTFKKQGGVFSKREPRPVVQTEDKVPSPAYVRNQDTVFVGHGLRDA